MARQAKKGLNLSVFKDSIVGAHPLDLTKAEMLIAQERARQVAEEQTLRSSQKPLELSAEDLEDAEDGAPAVQ